MPVQCDRHDQVLHLTKKKVWDFVYVRRGMLRLSNLLRRPSGALRGLGPDHRHARATMYSTSCSMKGEGGKGKGGDSIDMVTVLTGESKGFGVPLRYPSDNMYISESHQ